MNDDKPTPSPDRPMYDTPHQPEHLYAKDICPDCQAKQETIDKLRDTVQMNNHTADYLIAKCDRLRTALAGMVGWRDDESLKVIEWQLKKSNEFRVGGVAAFSAIKALRETKP